MSEAVIRIIDYKAGNAPSVMHAVEHLGLKAGFARTPEDLKGATHIILPGVGSARATMDSLRESGLVEALTEAVIAKKVFFLGICVGMQILFEHSEEENADCLGFLKGKVVKFDEKKVRVPQMGWNGVWDGFYYFVNSYYAVPENKEDVWGEGDYNGGFTAAVKRGNIYGTQFHAEKSGKAGLKLLEDFLCLQKD